MKTLVDSQEYKDILGDATTTGSLASYMSTYNREKTINDQVVAQAEADAPKSNKGTWVSVFTPLVLELIELRAKNPFQSFDSLLSLNE